MQGHLFWELGTLTDSALLDGLHRIVGAGRQLLAELLAHLCEVEDRRLHLDAGYPSMFAYCTGRLRLSEDEAYRRIEVARLARRVPRVYTLIAEGRLSLSAAALLKPYILTPNITELVDAVSDKPVQAAREALAAFFPRPDVEASIRKLPTSTPRPSAPGAPLFDTARNPPPTSPSVEPSAAPAPPAHTFTRALEPLSADRYKIQFTGTAPLKEKLQLARDLLRHTLPDGDLGTIVERALDLLVAHLMKRRFGAGARPKRAPRAARPQSAAPQPPSAANEDDAPTAARPPPSPASDNVTRDTCRRVLERAGLRCTWHGPDGNRCTARAWIERDHRTPRALGGAADTDNIRHLCRAHNQRAAEHVYGTRHIQRAIHRKHNKRPKPITPTHAPSQPSRSTTAAPPTTPSNPRPA
jgi:hypothetical protein